MYRYQNSPTRAHTYSGVTIYKSFIYEAHLYAITVSDINTAHLNETESQWNEAKTRYKVIASWTTTPRSLLLKVLITRGRYTCVYSLSCVLRFSRGLKSNIPLTQLRLKCITDSISLTHCCFNNHSMTSDSLTPETRQQQQWLHTQLRTTTGHYITTHCHPPVFCHLQSH